METHGAGAIVDYCEQEMALKVGSSAGGMRLHEESRLEQRWGDAPANTDPSHQHENLDRILSPCSDPDRVSATSPAESTVSAPSPLCARGSTVQSFPYLLEALKASETTTLLQLGFAATQLSVLLLRRKSLRCICFSSLTTPPHPTEITLHAGTGG